MNPDTPETDPPKEAPTPDEAIRGTRAAGPVVALGLMAVAAIALGLYGIASRSGKHVAHTGACAASLNLAEAADPLVHGDVAALTLATEPNPLGAVAFDNTEGRKTTIDALKGKTILLNLWATWCVPCREEMPALDRLQAAMGSRRFSVVPVNVDTARLDRPKAFLKEIGATNLPFYADSSADILQELRGKGLPTTVLVGADGCEIGTMAGPAQWDSPDARALIERLEQPAAPIAPT